MRQVDRWLGVPICVLLTACRRVGSLWRLVFRRSPVSVQRIVIVKLAEQGATVLAYPAIRRASDRVGSQNVFFLVFEENRFILDAMEVVPPENVLTIPTHSIWSVSVGVLKALRQLRRLRVDAAIDWEFFARGSAAFAYLSGAPIRVGLHACADGAPYRGRLMTHELCYDPTEHTSDLYVRMVEALDAPRERLRGSGPVVTRSPLARNASEEAGCDPPTHVGSASKSTTGITPGDAGTVSSSEDELPDFHPKPNELAEMKAVVGREAGTSRWAPLVLLNANASDLLPLRRWPSDRYVELARRLIDRGPNIHVAFTGAPDEAEAAAELVRVVGSGRCFSMAGKTALRQLLVLYCLADVLVTNDSGPAHFAAITPVHVVTLFGPETPARFGSRSPRSHVVWKGIPCSPCVDAYNNRLSTCRNNECMQQITVDEVLDAVARILGV